MNKKISHTLISALFATAIFSSASRAAGVQGLSKPSQDVTLSGSRPGRVAEVLVKEGESVKKGQPVVQLDDREEQAVMAQDKAKAEDDTRVKAQQAIRDQAEVDLHRVEWLKNQGGSSPFELDEAKVKLVVAEAQVKIEQASQEQARLTYEQAKVVVDKMILRSPFDGVVAQRLVSPGEAIELQTKVMRLAVVDPMWVEVPVLRSQMKGIAKDNTAQITFSDKSVAPGKIIYVAPVADPASDTILVRLEIANPDGRQPGEPVMVDFSPTKVAHD